MRGQLTPHPAFPCEAVAAIAIEAERPSPGRLLIRYRLSGVTDALVLPPESAGRADELWRHTCLEAFVQPAPGPGYLELNLSPGGAWAAYDFAGPRQGMQPADLSPPQARRRDGDGSLEIAVAWDLAFPTPAAWRLGVTAVIEEAGGRLSYWALAHPPGRPDFHDPDCFTLELPAPEAP